MDSREIRHKILLILEMVKFEHTIFALPFAFMGAFLAADGVPSLRQVFWILVAMVGARNSAMAFNRIVDAEIDAKNPRTANRAIPTGMIKKSEAWIFIVASALLFFLAAFMLNRLAFILSFPTMALILLYSYTKRLTSLSHLILGFADALAPIGGWIAIRGDLTWPPIVLGLGVTFWIGGFDILYSCLDYEFDQKEGLFSIPRVFGMVWGLRISTLFHILAALFFFLTGILAHLGSIYLVGCLLTSIFLIYEHLLVKPNDLSKMNLAFFTLNGYVSVILSVTMIADILRG